jgi:hypothetical protein
MLYFNLLDGADVSVVGLCRRRRRRRGVRAMTRRPCPRPDAPTPALGAPRRTIRRSWLTRRGYCTTSRGKARSTTSGSYWMSGPGGGSTLRAPMATRAGLMSTKSNNTTTNRRQWRRRRRGGGGRADATTTTTFDPAAGRIVRSTRIDDDDDDWSVRSRTRGSGRCCGRRVPSRTMSICRRMGRF